MRVKLTAYSLRYTKERKRRKIFLTRPVYFVWKGWASRVVSPVDISVMSINKTSSYRFPVRHLTGFDDGVPAYGIFKARSVYKGRLNFPFSGEIRRKKPELPVVPVSPLWRKRRKSVLPERPLYGPWNTIVSNGAGLYTIVFANAGTFFFPPTARLAPQPLNILCERLKRIVVAQKLHTVK